MKGQLCLRCLGSGVIAVSLGGGRREPWTYFTPEARSRMEGQQRPCDGCDGTGNASSDLPMLEFLTSVVVNVLGMFSHEGLDADQAERLDEAYNTAWAIWYYYHQDGAPDANIQRALVNAVQRGRDRLGYHPYRAENRAMSFWMRLWR